MKTTEEQNVSIVYLKEWSIGLSFVQITSYANEMVQSAVRDIMEELKNETDADMQLLIAVVGQSQSVLDRIHDIGLFHPSFREEDYVANVYHLFNGVCREFRRFNRSVQAIYQNDQFRDVTRCFEKFMKMQLGPEQTLKAFKKAVELLIYDIEIILGVRTEECKGASSMHEIELRLQDILEEALNDCAV